VLSGTRMPSALVEIGFISHPQEGRKLGRDKYQERVAQALADAVRDFADQVLARRLFAQMRPEDQGSQAPKVNVAGVVAGPSGTR
jgi:hypothetical protein